VLLLLLALCTLASRRVTPSPITGGLGRWKTGPKIRAGWQESLPSFTEFKASLGARGAQQVVGVYAQGLFAYPVVQQPPSQPTFVASVPGVVTQFALPSRHGTLAFLAHNYLSGKAFFDLRPGQFVVVVYGDGRYRRYRVNGIRRMRALTPTSPYSDFMDLHGGKVFSSGQVFRQVYANPDRLVFQTCISRGREDYWGRLFVSATPVGQVLDVQRLEARLR
jgi:hypothetical protein